MSSSINSQTKNTKRSSLKKNENLTPEEIEKLKQKSKRLSVNFNNSVNLTQFDLSKKKISVSVEKVSFEKEENKKFKEIRRKSVKNEFTLVKEMMKKNNFLDEIDDEITKKNTKLNEKHETTDSSENDSNEE
jgi:hypothetical protein